MTDRHFLAMLVLLGGGCVDELVVRPVIDSPVDDGEASVFPDIDELAITLAHAGSERELVAQTFGRGEELAVSGAPFADDLVMHLTGFFMGGISSYGRTCPFVVEPGREPPTPHVFLSKTVKFASTGIASLERSGGRAVAFNGSAIVLGGASGSGPVLEIEQFDPMTGALISAGRLSDRTGAVGARLGLAPARVAVIGGETGGFGASFIELVDPARSVEVIDDLHMARVGITATSLTDGRVIAIGGHTPGSVPVGLITELALSGQTVEIREVRAMLAQPRTGHTATRLGDDVGAPVLIAGGTGGLDGTGAPIAIAELFKPLSEELARPATFAPAMLVPRSRHHATLMPDGSVLFVGGIDAGGNSVRTLELFSLDAGFVAVGELPASAGVIDSTVTVLPDGRILIVGGRTAPGGPALDTAWIARLDPLDGSVDIVPTDRLEVARAGHQASMLCDGTVLITGGGEGSVVIERYNPAPSGRR